MIFSELKSLKTKAPVNTRHYEGEIQPISYILANSLGFCEGNIIKYITRHDKKNGDEDIRKAIHYCLFILKQKYKYSSEDIKNVLSKYEV